MTIKICIDSRVLVKLEEILRKLAILPYTLNQVTWVLSEQVGDKGLRRTL